MLTLSYWMTTHPEWIPSLVGLMLVAVVGLYLMIARTNRSCRSFLASEVSDNTQIAVASRFRGWDWSKPVWERDGGLVRSPEGISFVIPDETVLLGSPTRFWIEKSSRIPVVGSQQVRVSFGDEDVEYFAVYEDVDDIDSLLAPVLA